VRVYPQITQMGKCSKPGGSLERNVRSEAGKRRASCGRIMERAGSAALGLALCLLSANASAQAPEVGGLLPSGGPRGATTVVKIDGKNLQGAKLYLSGAGVSVRSSQVTPAGDLITVQIQVEPGASLGPHDVRIATAKGVSNGARFWVDVLPNRVFE